MVMVRPRWMSSQRSSCSADPDPRPLAGCGPPRQVAVRDVAVSPSSFLQSAASHLSMIPRDSGLQGAVGGAAANTEGGGDRVDRLAGGAQGTGSG